MCWNVIMWDIIATYLKMLLQNRCRKIKKFWFQIRCEILFSISKVTSKKKNTSIHSQHMLKSLYLGQYPNTCQKTFVVLINSGVISFWIFLIKLHVELFIARVVFFIAHVNLHTHWLYCWLYLLNYFFILSHVYTHPRHTRK